MKLYVKASKEISKSYDKVSEVLQKLFGFDYSRYKKESDWFESDKFGTIKYQLSSAMNNPNFYRIAILFDGDNVSDNFNKFLSYCKDNNIYISAKYPKGDKNSYHKWGTNIPQINIRVEKVYAYTYSDIKKICDFIKSYTDEITGNNNAKCEWGEIAGTQNVELRLEYYGYNSVGPGGNIHRSEEWCNNNLEKIDEVKSTVVDAVMNQFPNIKQMTIKLDWVIGLDFRLKF